MIHFDSDPLTVEGGVMFGQVTIDGTAVRAGITLPAFEQVVARAGFDPDRDLEQMKAGDIVALLRPTIEAYLQSKHLACPDGEPLIIEVGDLVIH